MPVLSKGSLDPAPAVVAPATKGFPNGESVNRERAQGCCLHSDCLSTCWGLCSSWRFQRAASLLAVQSFSCHSSTIRADIAQTHQSNNSEYCVHISLQNTVSFSRKLKSHIEWMQRSLLLAAHCSKLGSCPVCSSALQEQTDYLFMHFEFPMSQD